MIIEFNTDKKIENLITKIAEYHDKGIIENVDVELLPDYEQIGFEDNGYKSFKHTGHSELIIKIKLNYNLTETRHLLN